MQIYDYDFTSDPDFDYHDHKHHRMLNRNQYIWYFLLIIR